MKRIHFFIIVAFAGVIGTVITMITGLNWSCLVATIIIIPGIALSLELYFKERREKEEKLYTQLIEKENTISIFKSNFGIDHRRAEMLYSSGYKKLEDFKNKSVEDLMQIDDINPTLAKRIVQKMEGY